MKRFTTPEIARLPISNGDWIDVKKKLNHGEREDFFATIAPFDTTGTSKVDRHLLRTTRVMTYLVGWSLMNEDKPVPMSPDLPESQRVATIRSLDTETFEEIHAAIVKHEEAMEAEKVAAKNDQGTPTASAAI